MLPVLYSFRRCPYAMRARYALAELGVSVYLREVLLKSKPQELLLLGGRSTVPQLIDLDGTRYPESLDIIFWSLARACDTQKADELWPKDSQKRYRIMSWVAYNDHFFKHWLDRYKYADRHPECSEAYYRGRGEVFLSRLEKRLENRAFIGGDTRCLADIAIFPFIRQFAAVNPKWFDLSEYTNVKRWLAYFVNSDQFISVVMEKHPAWHAGQEDALYPATELDGI